MLGAGFSLWFRAHAADDFMLMPALFSLTLATANVFLAARFFRESLPVDKRVGLRLQFFF